MSRMVPAEGSLAALRAATAAYEERRAADEAAALARAEAERAAASELNAAARALSDFEQELTQARQNFTLRVAVCDTLQLDLCRGVLTRCLLYTSPSPRDKRQSRMPSSA